MLNVIYSYIFNIIRKESDLTLQKESELTGIDQSYLNKIENNSIVPNDRKANSFFKHFEIDSSYDEILENYIYQSMDLIACSKFENEITNLSDLIKKYSHSIYLPYLKLLMFAVDEGRREYGIEFDFNLKLLIKSINSFPDEFKRFFYIYYCLYLIKRHHIAEYLDKKSILESIPGNKWKPLEIFGEVMYGLQINDTARIPIDLDRLNDALKEEPNLSLKNSMYTFYAIFYNNILDRTKSVEYFKKSMDLWNTIGDKKNYAASASNVAWVLTLDKKYDEAIPYWLIANKYRLNETSYFNLAWCYYVTNQKELALNVINDSKKAREDDRYHLALIKWLNCHIKDEYCQKASKQLKQIYDIYFSTMTKDMQKFLLIALIKQAKHDQNHDDYYKYTDILINANVNSSIAL